MNLDTYQKLSIQVEGHRIENTVAIKEVLIQLLWLGVGFYLSSFDMSWVLGQIVLGTGFWRSFAVLHACGHRSFFSSQGLNELTGIISSIFCFIPYYSWKYIHDAHHLWTGWKDKDPTTSDTDRELKVWEKNALNFCWKYWLPVISLHYIFTVFVLPKKRAFYKSSSKVIFSISFVLIVHLILLVILDYAYFRYFLLSAFIYLNMGDISLLSQHINLPLDHSAGRPVRPKHPMDQEQYSHTMVLPAWCTRWIALGFNQHALHHLFPRLPYYKSHLIKFEGRHTHEWKQWIMQAKKTRASALIAPQISN